MSTAFSLCCRDSGALVSPVNRRQYEDSVIAEALTILGRRTARANYDRANSPTEVKRYLMLRYAEAEREEFGMLCLDAKNRIVGREILGIGTVSMCTVHPREVVKAGLACNVSLAIVFHCHPSGEAEPSDADRLLTRAFVQAHQLVDIRLADHIVLAGVQSYSFAEHGLL